MTESKVEANSDWKAIAIHWHQEACACSDPVGHMESEAKLENEPRVEAGDRALEVLAEIMEMAPIRHMLGLNHTYESGCHCLRCKADYAIEHEQSAMNAQEQELVRRLNVCMADIDTLLVVAGSNLLPEVGRMIKLNLAEAERLLAERGEGR